VTHKKFMVIPALDTPDIKKVSNLAKKIAKHPMIYGFKIGFALGLTHGLKKTVGTIKKITEKPVIYDHQKGATDIPDTGELFAAVLADAGIDEAILFPQAGPITLSAWVSALRKRSIKAIVGGLMTHPAYGENEGGFISEKGIREIYSLALKSGIRAFVIPLTKAALVGKIFHALPFTGQCEFYSPGFGKQGGDPHLFPKIKRHYLIIGRSLIEAEDPVLWLDQLSTKLEGNNEA
jgi:orotidine-5'-phosphate decarboxylase